jgi:predicted phosphodiesterase
MVTLVTADLHLSPNPRDAYRLRWCEGLPDLLEKENADRLIIAGDLTSAKDYHGAWLTNKIVAVIRAAAEVCPVYIYSGNHDYTSAAIPFFGFLGKYDRVRWIKEITPLTLKGLGRCLFIPHQRKLDAWQNMAELKQDWDWVFAHATFKGARNEQEMELDGAPIGLMLGHRVVSGDVHVPQKLGPVTYVGPPFLINHGDSYTPRILLLTEHGMNQRLCEGPRKLLIEIGSLDQLEKQKTKPDDIIKLRYSLASHDYDKWPSVRKKIEEWAKQRRVLLDAILPVPLLDGKPPKRVDTPTPATTSDEDIIKAYCDRYRVGEKTLKLGLCLIERAT